MRFWIIFVLAVTMALAGCNGGSSGPTGTFPVAGTGAVGVSHQCVAAVPAALRGEIVSAVNNQRETAGLAPARESATLDAVAQRHACDMAASGSLSHTGSDGSSVMERVRSAGYSSCLAAENIAAGQRTASDAMSTWMNSPGHRANILNGEVEEIGVGRAVADGGDHYWVQVFARPC